MVLRWNLGPVSSFQFPQKACKWPKRYAGHRTAGEGIISLATHWVPYYLPAEIQYLKSRFNHKKKWWLSSHISGGQQQDSGVSGSLCLAESGEFPQSQGGLALLSKNWLKGTSQEFMGNTWENHIKPWLSCRFSHKPSHGYLCCSWMVETGIEGQQCTSGNQTWQWMAMGSNGKSLVNRGGSYDYLYVYIYICMYVYVEKHRVLSIAMFDHRRVCRIMRI